MRRNILLISIILVAGILIAQDAPRFGGALRVGKSADITTLYPWEMTDLETMFVFQNIYEPLVRLKKENADIEPCLATDWTASKDYKMWTFHLRKNVKFHDGTPFNANSVIESFANRQTLHAKVQKADDYTVIFLLEKPDAAFAITLSIEFHSVAGSATIKCFKEKCTKHVVVGTGPFIFQSWDPGKKLVLRANKEYWGGKPYLEEAVFIPFASNSDLIKALKNHSVDISTSILPNNITEIRGTSLLMFQSMPAMSLGYLGMNNEKPPFNKREVRIAISYAINKKELISKYFLNGQAGMLSKSCLSPTMFGYNKDLPDREYDPEKARRLLKEAGFPDGFETTLMPTGASRPYMPNPEPIAADVKKYLEAIGIKVMIAPAKSWGDFLKASFDGTYGMIMIGWIADTVDPNDFLSALLISSNIGSTNAVRWSNSTFDTMIENARSQSASDRIDTYQKAQLLFYEEMPLVPIVHAMQLAAWHEKVKGFRLHPAARFYLQNIWLAD